MSDEPNGADLGIDVLGIKANVKNVKSLNTILTFVTLVFIVLLAYMVFMHTSEAKDNAKETSQALKESNKEVATTLRQISGEQRTSMQELVKSINMQNCLTVRIRPDMTPQQRNDEQEFCKRITR
jgi:arginine exporter protein ArgO